ncbi:alpha/beta hydrolase-fold protein [Ornithinimicrobium cavernae]|uniref:alpha/beta hydrolase-fold protein n=1 Tax=Ornithinimicrobium cavernae TaxID=2666047 RepID=UPI00137990E8|nr:alpha/beta hydrolase-fold protein [Ornithinimicrobium cavernae]
MTRLPPPRPARRAVLEGGLLALAGAAGLSGCGSPRGDLAPVEEGRLITAHWPGVEPRWMLALPEAASATVIALHGYGGDAGWWFDPPLAPSTAQRLGIAVAAVDGGNSYWHARADGTDTGTMVIDDLLPVLERAGAPVDRVGLTGFSMGGYGALLLATRLPRERVLGVAAVSAAVYLSAAEAAPGAFDDAHDFARHDLFERVGALRAARLAGLRRRRQLCRDQPGARRPAAPGRHAVRRRRSRPGLPRGPLAPGRGVPVRHADRAVSRDIRKPLDSRIRSDRGPDP